MKSRRNSLRRALDDLYEQYNRRRYVHPDPLEFLYEYDDPRDREIVALLAASLAYGRVAMILRNVRNLLGRMGPSPRGFLERVRPEDLPEVFAGFKHRWTTHLDVAELLAGARAVLERHDSLGEAFAGEVHQDDETVLPALQRFTSYLAAGAAALRLDRGPTRRPNSLLPAVCGGGARKRLHLMLRWLVRRDEVDPGGWDGINPRQLVVPLDTHMHRLGTQLGLLDRRQPDGRAALALTEAFRQIAPADPVRYDFALTRLGIRSDCDPADFLSRCQCQRAATVRER